MQVANVQETASSANIGGGVTEEFGLVQDASFLMMLSKNLYTNQNLAPIREILCNAWDIHIESGKTDTPIEITITPELDLIIRDYGSGIAQRDIKKVYGTYGLSTKANNDTVTGGFGLGSKSPFAYVDSFRVISICEGIKTIYNMSAASVNNNGKPGITPLSTVATEEPNGITVTFRLRQEDVDEMRSYIFAIVKHGAMNAVFTEGDVVRREMDKIELGTEPGSYALDDPRDSWFHGYMGHGTVFVRYGAVIYPMLDTPGTHKALELLEEFTDLINVKRIVVQATPGSLTLQPGRETLSSSKMTERGLTDLCVNLVQKLEKDIIDKIPQAMNELEQRLRDYRITRNTRGGLRSRVNFWDEIFPSSVRLYMMSKLGIQYRAKYEERMIQAEKHGYNKKHVFKTSVKATKLWKRVRSIGLSGKYNNYVTAFTQFRRTMIMKPIAKLFCESNGVLKPKCLRMLRQSSYNGYVYKDQFMDNVSDFEDARRLIENPIIVVSKRIKKIEESVECCPALDGPQLVWIYHVGTMERNIPAIIAELEKYFTVVDLTVDNEWDIVAMEAKAEREFKASKRAANPIKPRSKNKMASIVNYYANKNQSYNNLSLCNTLVTLEADKPLFYVQPHEVYKSGGLGKFANFHTLTEDEKKNGIMVRNGVEQNMAIKRGAVSVNAYFARVFYEKASDPAYETYRTKYRKIGIKWELGILSGELRLARMMGFYMKDYDKMYHDPVKEILGDSIRETSVSDLKEYLTPEELDNYQRIRGLTLTPIKAVAKLEIIERDPVIRRFGSLVALESIIRTFPDRKAAIKSLVSIAIKNGTKKDD